jgi:ribosome-binding factor A
VAALIQETLASALATQVKDPRIGFATLTGVSVTPDYSHATIWVSVLGSEEEKQGAVEGLRSAGGFLRSILARALPLRTVPELHFVLDRGLEHAQRIDELLDGETGNDGEET